MYNERSKSRACLHVHPQYFEMDKALEVQPRFLTRMWHKKLPLLLCLGYDDSAG